MKAIKYYLNKIRFVIIKKLFTEQEKYLIIKAIESRQDILHSLLSEKWADLSQIKEDNHDLYLLKEIFRTDLTK
jgi:hypothetical protein